MKRKLPHSMRRRQWTSKKGKCECYYYERKRDERGQRKLVPLGSDYQLALIKWAELEGKPIEGMMVGTMSAIYQDYMQWAGKLKLSGLSVRTVKDREAYWKRLGPVFGVARPEQIKPAQLIEYFEHRSSQVAAKKEIKFLSILFNWANARGKANCSNPALGVTRFMHVDESRYMYVTDEDYKALWNKADQVVRDFMEFSYICGTRPEEAVSTTLANYDQVKKELTIRMVKTERRGSRVRRIPVDGDLENLLNQMKARRKDKKVTSLFILCDEKGQKLRLTGQLRYRFMKARADAIKAAEKEKRVFTPFQMRDIRAKAATDTALAHGLEAARVLLGHTTQKQTASYVRPLMGEAAKHRPNLAFMEEKAKVNS